MRACHASAALALAAAATACSQARSLQNDVRPSGVSWKESALGPACSGPDCPTDVAPLFARSCASCHSGATPAAGYDVSSYLGAIGVGRSGAPVVTAGDPNSLLLTTIDPAKADATHQGATDAGLFSTVSAWVVQDRLSYFRSQLHEGGILNPADPEFHGALLKKLSWSFSTCASCHGADFSGGTANVSCLQCHKQGPTSCTTCHGQPPATGAHAIHASGGTLARPFDCAECHVKPTRWDDAGHLFAADGTQRTQGAVAFGALASLPTAQRTAAPSWSHETAGCSATYCHGGGFVDPSATRTTPRWNAGAADATCGSCHGLPPASHGLNNVSCGTCHPNATGTGALAQLTSTAKHIDGIVQVGDGTGSCSACHGSPPPAAAATVPALALPYAAPPRDLFGNTDPAFLGVGAHQAHLFATHGLAGRIECSACHVVPAAVNSPGHLDGSLPAKVSFQGLSLADGATPVWTHATAGCSATYCHGGGAKLADDQSPTLARTPKWTGGTQQAACGSCHGLPPQNKFHPGVMTLLDCNRCHANTVDKSGAIIVTGPPGAETSTHINGVADVIFP